MIVICKSHLMPSFLVSITASTTINSEANSIVIEEFIDYPADVATLLILPLRDPDGVQQDLRLQI